MWKSTILDSSANDHWIGQNLAFAGAGTVAGAAGGAVGNAGRLKISRSVLSDPKMNPLWSEWNRNVGGSRFFKGLLMRFNNKFIPINY